ncbi:MAG: acyltransferase [Clostridia bacterium]|nr:acyltransferase [Clostridia bacterium]
MENENRTPRHERKRFQPFLSYRMGPDAKHLDVLDGVRVLCILLVGWFHIWQQSWLSPYFMLGNEAVSLDFLLRSGYLWVDGMLLLSGFLLYLPYTQAGSRLPDAFAFYKRRLIRIVPSYLLCIVPMFVLCCVRGKYEQVSDAALDIVTHLTFTHNLFYFSYLRSPLNGALWTLAVEMQFYLIFPFLARAFRKLPALTYAVMAGAAFAFRFYASLQPDTSMFFNQLPAFLDVYANGFVAAAVFASLRKRLGNEPDAKTRLFFTVMAVVCVCALMQIARAQASASSYDAIRQGQMDRRFPLTATLSCFMVCAAFSLPAMRFLLGNKVMRFLSLISFQFYIYHQMLAVKLKEWGFPPSPSATPWADGDYRWQVTYTLCCFVFALVLAALITFLFERPIARLLRRRTGAEKG